MRLSKTIRSADFPELLSICSSEMALLGPHCDHYKAPYLHPNIGVMFIILTPNHMGVARNRGLSRPPASVTSLCRGPSVTNPRRGPLWTVLQSSRGLSQGAFVARPPNSATSLVAKRRPRPVTSPMFLGHCHTAETSIAWEALC